MKISPDLSFTLYISFSLIFILIVLLFVLDMLYLFYKDLKKPNVDLYQYKITNFFYTYIIMYIYIICFILLVFYLRILYIDNPADLKLLYNHIKAFVIYFLTLPILYKIYLFIIIILGLLILLFSLVIFQTISFREFFKFHVYYIFVRTFIGKYNTSLASVIYTSFVDYLQFHLVGQSEIISAMLTHFAWKFENYYSLEKFKIFAFFDYIFVHKYYKILFKISPFIFLFYDSIFHNYILQTFVYYMLIYTPLIIINRIGNSVLCNKYLIELLQDLYYKTPDNVYFCVPKDLYPIMIENRLLHGLKTNLDLDMPTDENNSIFLLANYDFKQDPNNIDMISNQEGITLIKYPGGKFYRLEFEYEEGKYDLGEEWILLQHKDISIKR